MWLKLRISLTEVSMPFMSDWNEGLVSSNWKSLPQLLTHASSSYKVNTHEHINIHTAGQLRGCGYKQAREIVTVRACS